jgi:predicted esterase
LQPNHRSQLVYRDVPPGREPGRATLVLLHGNEGLLDDLVPFARSLGEDLALVAAEAARGVYLGQMLVSRQWFGVAGPTRPEPASFGDSLWQIEQFVYDLLERQDGSALPYLLGYKEGGALALAAASVLPDRLAGVISIGGYVPRIAGWSPPFDDLGGLPILLVAAPGHAAASAAARSLRRRNADVARASVPDAPSLEGGVGAAVRAWLEARGATTP